jgi:hypothetical protein
MGIYTNDKRYNSYGTKKAEEEKLAKQLAEELRLAKRKEEVR